MARDADKKSRVIIKTEFILRTLGLTLIALAQVSYAGKLDSYYGNLDSYQGNDLRSRIKAVISKSHHGRSYSDLFEAYFDGDIDKTYEGDLSIVDIYSEDPITKDPYTFESINQKCGSYRGESNCFNREHLFPQSVFHKRSPMRSDYYHVFPTDGYVNGKRSNYPFGEVSNPEWSSRNGSKLGSNSISGYNGRVFEPIDEFKGDVARALLYFGTRYEDNLRSFKNYPMLDKSSGKFYSKWFLEMLLRWHKQDPVSEYEQNRNEAGFRFQGNRNPYVDHPEWVERAYQ